MSEPGGWPAPTIAGYDITGEIGRGGFATVYEAVQQSVGRRVALKVLSATILGPDLERRFRSECRTVGELSWHPHVVAVYDAGFSDEGHPYLAMELIPGGSLGQRVRARGAMSPEEVIRVGAEVADALAAAHEAGVVHRDVKPDNILIGRRSSHMLGDFGIATISDATQSVTGTFAGTYAFCAPEVLKGDRASPASDVFALGVTLHMLTTGKPTFTRSSSDAPGAVILRVMTEAAPTLDGLLPPAVAQVVERAMAKDPGERYPTAGAFLEALESATAPARAPEAAAPAAITVALTVAPVAPIDDDAPPSGERVGVPHATRSTPRENRSETTVARPVPDAAPDAPVDGPHEARLTPGRAPSMRSMQVGRDASHLIAALGSLWVTTSDGITIIDPMTNRLRGRVRLDDVPTAIAADGQSTWIIDDGPRRSIKRINAASRQVDLDVRLRKGLHGVLVDEDLVWVSGGERSGVVLQLDRHDGSLLATIPVGRDPQGLAARDDALWVACSGSGTVSQIDTGRGEERAAYHVGRTPWAVAANGSGVWVTCPGDDTVVHLDPATGERVAVIAVGQNPRAILATPDDIWVTSHWTDTVSRIDPRTDAVVEVIPVGHGPWGIEIVAGTLWVANTEDGTVSRIDR